MVRGRAAGWRAELATRGVPADLVDVDVAVGGGTLADEPLASAALALTTPDPDGFARRLRAGNPPVFARIHEGRVLFDARTVLPGEDAALITAIAEAL